MSEFCTRCGAPLNEDGRCPNCDASYSVEGIFDEPQVYGNSYGSDDADTADITGESIGSNAVDEIPYAEDVPEPAYTPQNSDYGYGYHDSGNDSGGYSNYGTGGSDYQSQYYAPPASEQPTPSATTAPPRKRAMSAGDMLKDWLNCAISFFKEDPFAAAERVTKGDTYLWAIFAGLNVVFGSFCIAGMFGNGFKWLVEKVFGSYVVMLVSTNNDYTFGNMFGLFMFSLLMLAALFCATVGCAYGVLSVNKKKPRIEALIRVVAIAFFPMTAACVAAYIFSFFMIRLAGFLLFVGAIASFHLFNELVRRENGDLPFWHVVLCNAAQLLAGAILVSIALAVI